MVHFGKQLLLLQYEPWKASYLDYNRLKFVLEGQGDAAAFEILLQQEVERVALFLLQQQGLVATELARLCLLDDSTSSSSCLLSDYRAVGESIVQLLRFVQLNVTALRKILKKHDRLFTNRKLTWKLLQQQQQQRQQNPTLLSHHCYYHVRVLLAAAQKNNPHLQALIQSLQRGLQAIHKQQPTQLQQQQQQQQYANQAGFFTPRRSHTEPNLLLPLQQQQQLQPQRTSTSSNLMDFLQQSTSSSSSLSTSLLLLRQEPILWRIQLAQGRLDESSSRLVQLLAAPLLEENTTSAIDEEEEEEETLQSQQAQQQEEELATVTATVLPTSSSSYSRSISNILNLLSTFLYLTNYYIAAPTSGAYAARLHNNNNNNNTTNGSGSQVLAGLVMGMTPTAALAGTLLYSYWTSYSYKAALVFAAAAAIVGNVLYAGALPSHNLSWILAGRLLIGLGSCRSINRRYIADAYTRTTRTAAAATFVTAGSAGMAVGPALAALLHYVTPNSSSSSTSSSSTPTMNDTDKRTNDWWSVENAPGWVMAVAWTVYLVVLLLYFQDPPRHSNNDSKNNVSTIASKATVVGNSGGGGGGSGSRSQDCTTHEGERQALLSKKADSLEIAHHKTNEASESFMSNHSDNDDDDASNTTSTTTAAKASSWHYTTIPVVATLVICFLLKMTLECLLSSTATVTSYYFDWDTGTVGMYLALQGLCMFPANLMVAAASQGGYEDRDIILWTLVCMTIGTWGIMEYNNNNGQQQGNGNHHYDDFHPTVVVDDDASSYTIFQYIFFGMIIFIATNALEGPNMSLLSKTIPKRWSVGFFNMGLLATEAGTLGRTVGDFCITWFGLGSGGIESMLNHTFFVLSITLSITVVVTYKIFPFLEPRD